MSDVIAALFPWPAALTYPLWFYGGHLWTAWLCKRRNDQGGVDGPDVAS